MNSWNTLYGQTVKRKVFICYYHKDDQYYRDRFETLFGHLFINRSVDDGDIDSNNSDEYIKKLIQNDYISDASVVVVLLGAKTYCRKHVDWEISAGLNKKVGGYSGLIGILLPTHPDYGRGEFFYNNVPERFADNCKTGYANTYDWSENSSNVSQWIESAFNSRVSETDKIDNSRIQYTYNRCD